MTGNKIKLLKIFLIFLSVLASLKMIFFAVGLDEEYQVVMSYRNAMGDKLFLNMWEPHQSSAFLCTLLMKPYLRLFGTTGVIIYLRAWGTLLHLAVSIYLYRVLRDMIDKDYAWMLSLIYYNTIPKQIMTPEFGMMQVWFYTLLSLFLIRFYLGGRRKRYLALGAVSLALTILSYPSCLLLFPFVLIFIIRFSGNNKWQDAGLFILVCALCAAGYLGMLFTYTTPKELVNTLSFILKADVTHNFSPSHKFLLFLQKGLYEVALWTGCWLVATAVAAKKKLDKQKKNCIIIMLACLVQLFYWVVLNIGYESMHIHLIAITVAGLGTLAKTHNNASKVDGLGPSLLKYGILGAVLCLLAVVYLTDISLTESIPHAMPAAFYGAALLVLSCKTTAQKGNSKWLQGALIVWCLTAVFGKGYTLRASTDYSNVLQSGGILKQGPAAGTFSKYITAYIYNCDYQDWEKYLQDGDRVLIIIDQIQNLGTIQYLFKDVEISHYSIVNFSFYDERLLEYWEMYPDKKPNVIIVDCWYGELKTDPEGWIMKYIENDFGYTQVNDGTYIRIYRQ